MCEEIGRSILPTAVTEGIDLFDAGRYWDAHEAWERLWLEADGALRIGVQGLIQLAAALYHVERGNQRGAGRLFRAAALKLSEGVVPGLDLRPAADWAVLQAERSVTPKSAPPRLRSLILPAKSSPEDCEPR